MTPTQVLHTVYLCIIAGIVILGFVVMLAVHHDGVNDGKKACAEAQQKAVDEQRVKDAEATQDVVDGLNQDKLRLQAELDAKPRPPVIHQCGRVFQVDSPLRPTPSTARAQPGEPAHGALDSSVSSGSGGGDVGPGVRALAAAGAVLAIYRQRLWDYEVETR